MRIRAPQGHTHGWIICLAVAGCTSAPIDCESSDDCSAAGLVCDVDRETCVECLVDRDCMGAGEVCRARQCEVVVPCTSNPMCPNQVCDPVRMYCVDCVEDADCEAPLECDDEGFCAPPPPPSCREADACVPGTRTRTNEGCEPGLDRRLRCDEACELIDDGECEPIEGCPGVPACTPGTLTRSSAGCEADESREMICNTMCQFDPLSECTPDTCRAPDACTPGEDVWVSEGCADREIREVRCSDACVYETITECADNTCDSPGSGEYLPCGSRCGLRARVCNEESEWEYAVCADDGDCVAGTTDIIACGACGTQPAHCNETCDWIADEECSGEGSCMAGTQVVTNAGCEPHEVGWAYCSATCEPGPIDECIPLVVPGRSVMVPYLGTPSPDSYGFSFHTAIQTADVYFLFDDTASMQVTIDSVEAAITAVIGGLTCERHETGACTYIGGCFGTDVCYLESGHCVEGPSIDGCVPNLYSGAGSYEVSLDNQLSLQPNPAVTSAELAMWTADGPDTTEQLYDALYSLADPRNPLAETGCTGPSLGRVGCPAFRPNARRFALVFTDEPDNGGTTSASTAGAALFDEGITLIGINTGLAASRTSLVDVATAANSFRGDGVTPLVFDATADTVGTVVDAALDEAILASPQEITARVEERPGDDGDALPFIASIRTNTTAPGCPVSPTADTDGDGSPDTFLAVAPGTDVCFDVVAAPNISVPSGSLPAVFQAQITIFGDGSPLDERVLYFWVPAGP